MSFDDVGNIVVLKSRVGCFVVGSNRLMALRVGNNVNSSDDTPTTGAGVGFEVISEKMRIVLSSVGEADGRALGFGVSDGILAEGDRVVSISVVEADGLALLCVVSDGIADGLGLLGVISDDIADGRALGFGVSEDGTLSEGDSVVSVSVAEADGRALIGVFSVGLADGMKDSTSDPTTTGQPK
jgi:hypothetical protein